MLLAIVSYRLLAVTWEFIISQLSPTTSYNFCFGSGGFWTNVGWIDDC